MPYEPGYLGTESKLALPGASTDASLPVACVVQHLGTLSMGGGKLAGFDVNVFSKPLLGPLALYF